MILFKEHNIKDKTVLKYSGFELTAFDFYVFQTWFDDDSLRGYVIVLNPYQIDGTCVFFLVDPDVDPQETIKYWCRQGFIDTSVHTVKYKKLDNRYINDITYIESEAQKVF